MTQDRKQPARSQPPKRRWRWGMIVGGVGVLATCVAIRAYWGADRADAQFPSRLSRRAAPAARPAPQQTAAAAPARAGTTPAAPGAAASGNKKVVALVNGEQITREDLARECLWHYGTDVLESMVNKHLIVQQCARHQITVTREEVDTEIKRMSSRFNLPVDRWMKMLEQERGITPDQYANEIIWPTLALRKLAGKEVEVTPQELQREFETQYGPSVQVRLIMCSSAELAGQIRAKAEADPAQFGALAKQHSEDVNSASAEGLIQPVRRHVGYKEIEQAAFSMKDGEISPVLKVGNQFVILKRERLIPGRAEQLAKLGPQYKESILNQMEEAIRDQKLRDVANTIFRKLQDAAQVQIVFNDPARREQMPGVAALINGQQITLAELAEECIARHGHDVLEGAINRRLIEQACKRRGVTVTDADLDREIAEAAAQSVPPLADGSPDVETYLERASEEQGVSPEIFRRDSVWPSAALRKLVGEVEVSEEDVDRGFLANFGPRVRCRAIVMNDQRRALEVWDKARSRLSPEFFGELARQYSIDAASGSMGGQIPPVKRYGGRPALEEQAFKLQPGQLSGVFQMDGKYVILYCEGLTEPVAVGKDEVREELAADIRQKKLRIAMGQYFKNLQESASIDNYLAGEVHQPKQKATAVKPAGYIPTLREKAVAR